MKKDLMMLGTTALSVSVVYLYLFTDFFERMTFFMKADRLEEFFVVGTILVLCIFLVAKLQGSDQQ
jgi:hypothetical protein